MIEKLNSEMKKVTTLLEFLVIQPSLLDGMVEKSREKIMVENLLRMRCCSLWSENMVKELESKCSKESVTAIDELFKLVEVKKQ